MPLSVRRRGPLRFTGNGVACLSDHAPEKTRTFWKRKPYDDLMKTTLSGKAVVTAALPAALPARLLEVLTLAAEGLTDKEIAQKLGLGETTVITHWKRLRERYDLPNKASIIARHLQEEVEPLREAHEALLYEVARRKQAELELSAVNARLSEGLDQRAQNLAHVVTTSRREGTRLLAKLRDLSFLTEALGQTSAIVSQGEMTFPFRKTMMSDEIRKYGYTPAQFTEGELGPEDLIHPDDLGEVLGAVESGLAANQGAIGLRYRVRDAQGQYHAMIEVLWIHRDEQSRPQSYTGVAVPDL